MSADETPKAKPADADEQQPDQYEDAVDEIATDTAEPESAIASMEEELSKYREQALRAQAEMQNVRRRAEIDVEKAHKFALEKFVRELLPVVDSLEKAVENSAGDSELLVRIREGVEMTLNMMLGSLGKFNVEQLDPMGEPFDPQLHEAMSMVPSPEVEPNTVVGVMQKGYTLNGRLVRPAMVMISKAGDVPIVDEKA
jgi:molecular chaperone GrpE